MQVFALICSPTCQETKEGRRSYTPWPRSCRGVCGNWWTPGSWKRSRTCTLASAYPLSAESSCPKGTAVWLYTVRFLLFFILLHVQYPGSSQWGNLSKNGRASTKKKCLHGKKWKAKMNFRMDIFPCQTARRLLWTLHTKINSHFPRKFQICPKTRLRLGSNTYIRTKKWKIWIDNLTPKCYKILSAAWWIQIRNLEDQLW